MEVVAVVLDDEVDLATVHATLGVDVLEHGVGGLGHVGVPERGDTGQRHGCADGDLVAGHTIGT